MKLIFAGTPANAAAALELVAKHHEVALVITRPDAEVGRKRTLTPSPVAQCAEKLGLSVLKTAKIDVDAIQAIKDSGADIGLVIAYGALLPQTALNALPWWNIHFSLLPQWRGATPLQQSILHEGLGAGVTLFELDKGMDTGPILAQIKVQLRDNETTLEALPRFTTIGTELALSCLKAKPTPKPQVGEASFAPKVTRLDSRLNLTLNANQIHARVCAFNPEPTAWFELDDQPFRVLRTRSLGLTNWVGEHLNPGRITESNGRILLECAAGTQVELLEVQPSGKNSMAAGDWFRGLNRQVILG